MHWRFPKNNSLYKNKRILRTVDQVIVDQGRWSVFGHLIIFAAVEWLMGFRAIPAVMSYSFALIFLVVALSRLYFLLNFSQHYGRGPARWRNQYGLLTLLGAALWSGYLTLTIVHPGYTSSLTFVWLYTAAVAATHIFIFAAYRAMAQWYNGILLIPPGIAGIAMLQWEMVTLGMALLLFFAFMELTSRQVSARFWETQRSRQSLELALGETSAAEHQAGLQAEANQHSLVQLIQMMRQPLGRLNAQLHQQQRMSVPAPTTNYTNTAALYANDLTSLLDQFELYVRIKSHEFDEGDKVFSINRQIEQALLIAEPVASLRGLDLSCAIHPEVPERLLGQAKVLPFLLHQSLLFAIGLANGQEVTLKIQTDTDAKNLLITVRFAAVIDDHYWQQCQTLIRSDRTIESFPKYDQTILSLAICVLLVRHQQGKLALVNSGLDDFPIELALAIPIQVSTQEERLFQANKSLQDMSIWVAGFPNYGTRALVAELKSWGLNVSTLSAKDALAEDACYDFGLFNVLSHNEDDLRWLTQAESITQQGVALLYSPAQSHAALFRDFQGTQIRKPWLRRSLHRWLVHELQDPEQLSPSSAVQTRLAQAKVLLVSADPHLEKQLRDWFKPYDLELQAVSEATSILKKTRQTPFDMILIDEDISLAPGFEFIAEIRRQEREQQFETVPIISLIPAHHAIEETHRVRVGADQITKPVQASQLFECLERFWG